ncbi:MAG: metal-dependent hydrolase [Candidatus Pacebacteria bacterium CG10_big_fil_rev_8_21_14_0_10_42_12]|nr:MAG: metal-dependent hydrolase [Candidatus Pacebacteria bacterium CG10_big_fil_rev_8_21_14_0_10_42_12]
MITNANLLIVGNLEVFVVNKNIKNLHLSLLPPNGSIRVSVPNGTTENIIRSFVAFRSTWIKKQQQKYNDQSRQTRREYVSGETHYFLGKPYQLEVIGNDKGNGLSIRGKKTFLLKTKTDITIEQKERIFNDWYRKELRHVLDKLIKKWQPEIKVRPTHWRIQRMKTRWGTCNRESGRVIINLELIKKPYHCIEYVVVYEWLHLTESKHDEKFIPFLDKHLPKWRQAKEELNRFILTHQEWN